MSLSKPTWHHFAPHQHFLEKQPVDFYRDALSPSFLSPVALSLSAAFSHPISSNSANMNALSADEMERFQKLSNSYQPEVQVIGFEYSDPRQWLTSCGQGPLVSTKQSSHSIALDYSNADPTLATKTNVSFGGLSLCVTQGLHLLTSHRRLLSPIQIAVS
jgi:ubiquitin thioesterase protein OTUB1